MFWMRNEENNFPIGNGGRTEESCVLEQDTLSSAKYWFHPGKSVKRPDMTEKLLTGK